MFRVFIAVLFMQSAAPLPDKRVTKDNTIIVESCRVVIPPDTVIEDADGNGVIHINASDVTIEFAPGSVLRGAQPGTPPDQYKGTGIHVCDQAGVTIRGARISGFWCGVHATRANGLTLDHVDASDQRRARLKSTPAAEDGGDWLWPHNNDEQEWRKNYGAAFCVEQSREVRIENCRVHDGQNGLILDRVSGADVSHNDFSFLSGWGIAMWRSSGNKLLNNSVDFCVRGYSHGVYNRGQDSAGFLVFEQCNGNVFENNSATHCGDGFFMFAGREALGDAPAPTPDFDYRRRGCNDNVLIRNDFSYAAAHGVEITFSFGNLVKQNRMIGNAICGIWGGYSQDMRMIDNQFVENGEGAYGLERGGVNIEHGRANIIASNHFERNKCAIHLWWDADEKIAESPWAKANGAASTQNEIRDNEFRGDELALQFRGKSDVVMRSNLFVEVGEERKSDADVTITTGANDPLATQPVTVESQPFASPVDGRKALSGRQNIVVTEWGPWDHSSPLLRRIGTDARSHRYELRKFGDAPQVKLTGNGVVLMDDPNAATATDMRQVLVTAAGDGVFPYTLLVLNGTARSEAHDTMIVATWEAQFFESPTDPREDDSFLSAPPQDVRTERVSLSTLRLPYGNGGPQDVIPELKGKWTRKDRFAMKARTHIPLTRGKWKLSTFSDDGVRVTVDGGRVIDNWTWHGPTRDEGFIDLENDKTVEIVVEHFELDGYSVVEFDLSPA